MCVRFCSEECYDKQSIVFILLFHEQNSRKPYRGTDIEMLAFITEKLNIIRTVEILF